MQPCDRFGNVEGEAERPIGFFLADTFSMLPFVSAVEPLRAANRLSGQALYSWHVFTSDGEPVRAGNGVRQAAEACVDEVGSFPTVIVCGPHDPNLYHDPKAIAWLQRLVRGGTRLGAAAGSCNICTLHSAHRAMSAG